MPSRCVELLEQADRILHAGDFVSRAALEELRGFGPVDGVAGNMDESDVRAQLPERCLVELGAVRIGMVHDPGPRQGRGERLLGMFAGFDAIVYGHTHEPEIARVGGVWILNPGSPTWRRRAPAHTMIVATVEAGAIRPKLVGL